MTEDEFHQKLAEARARGQKDRQPEIDILTVRLVKVNGLLENSKERFGMQQIPDEWPTEEMLDAGYETYLRAIKHPRLALGDAFQAMLAAAPTPPALEWSASNLPLPEDKEIEATHPLVTGRFDLHQEAIRLVSAKHSKFALVALVRWLLSRATLAEGKPK